MDQTGVINLVSTLFHHHCTKPKLAVYFISLLKHFQKNSPWSHINRSCHHKTSKTLTEQKEDTIILNHKYIPAPMVYSVQINSVPSSLRKFHFRMQVQRQDHEWRELDDIHANLMPMITIIQEQLFYEKWCTERPKRLITSQLSWWFPRE